MNKATTNDITHRAYNPPESGAYCSMSEKIAEQKKKLLRYVNAIGSGTTIVRNHEMPKQGEKMLFMPRNLRNLFLIGDFGDHPHGKYVLLEWVS